MIYTLQKNGELGSRVLWLFQREPTEEEIITSYRSCIQSLMVHVMKQHSKITEQLTNRYNFNIFFLTRETNKISCWLKEPHSLQTKQFRVRFQKIG